MGLFGFNSNDEERVLIFYVDSSSVGVSVIDISKNKLPTIVWSKRAEIAFGEELDFASFQNSTLTTLSSLVRDCAKAKLSRPDKFLGVISSPWFVSQTRVARIAADKPFVVTDTIVRNLVNDEIARFEKERKSTNSVVLSEENKVIEIHVMQISLNGYETRSPNGKKATDLKVSTFISMSSEKILNEFRKIINKSFHSEKVQFHTLPFVAYSTLRGIVPGPEQFMFIDINGEITDLSIVNKGIIMETISFPLGYNFLIRKLARSFSGEQTEAKSLLDAYLQNSLHPDLKQKIEDDIKYAKQEWLKSFARVLEMSSFEYLLPDTAYVVGHRRTLKFFSDFISDESLKQYSLTNKPFIVKTISSDLIKDLVKTTNGSESDVFLLLSAVFVNNFHTPD